MKTIIAILLSTILNYIGCVLFIYLSFEGDGTGWLGSTSDFEWFQISLMVAVIPALVMGILSGVTLSQEFCLKNYLCGVGLGIMFGAIFFLFILASTEMKANLLDAFYGFAFVSAVNIISNLITQFFLKSFFVTKGLD
jgi:hypothetical protein